MIMKKLAAVIRLASLAVATVALAACGGSDHATTPVTQQVSVPTLAGDTQAAATTAITAAGLTVGTVTMQSSNTVASGYVISETPAAGTSVASGSSVNLVVSSGAAYTVGGAVIGLASGATVHVVNGADNVPVSANGTFTFPTAVATGATYSVTVGTPQPAGQICVAESATGTAASGTVGSSNITNLVVFCVFNVTAATLTGPYTAVANGLSNQSDMLDSETFNGISSYSGSAIKNVAGVISTPSLSGGYTVAPTQSVPVLTVNNTDIGAVLGPDAGALVVLSNLFGGMQPGLFIGVNQAQNASVSSVNGSYTGVSLQSTTPASATLFTSALANSGTGTFASGQTNTNGTITTSAGSTGPYTVTANGAITVGNNGLGISGAVSADGDLIVLAPITSNGNGATPAIYVLVKQGSGVTAATINGVYTMVSLASSTAGGFVGAKWTVAMSNGGFSGAYTENDAGTTTEGNPVSGTYTTASNGTLNLTVTGGATLQGAVSADGNVFVLTDLTSGDPSTLMVGVRQ
jgi:hypothetical protein